MDALFNEQTRCSLVFARCSVSVCTCPDTSDTQLHLGVFSLAFWLSWRFCRRQVLKTASGALSCSFCCALLGTATCQTGW